MLVVRDLNKTYQGPEGSLLAIEGLSLQVAAGEFVAVQGPSGCGKTTLLLAAGGLLAPDGGQVLVGERDLFAMSQEERAVFRARHIGFVFQQFHLIPYLNVIDNVLAPSLALEIDDAGDKALNLIRRFGLEERIRHVPAELSTGERQRTAMARALLNGPGLILADEPTGNLDKETSSIVLDHLKEFVAAGGAVLLVTHDPEAASCAQRTVRLKKGKLAEAV